MDQEKLQRCYANLTEDVTALKHQLMESTAVLKEVVRHKDRLKEENDRLKSEFRDERKEMNEFKSMSEHNLSRLRKCIQEERSEYEERIRKWSRTNSSLCDKKRIWSQNTVQLRTFCII